MRRTEGASSRWTIVKKAKYTRSPCETSLAGITLSSWRRKVRGVALTGIFAHEDLSDTTRSNIAHSLLDGFVALAITERDTGKMRCGASTARLDERGQSACTSLRKRGDLGWLQHDGFRHTT